MNWEPRAAQLAAAVTHPASRWRPAVAAVPRHLFAPRWWAWTAPGDLWHDHWELRDGPADPAVWLDADFSGVLKAGMPFAQCCAVPRQAPALVFEAMSGERIDGYEALAGKIMAGPGVYRKGYRGKRG